MLQLFKPAGPIHWSWVSMIGPDAQDFLHRLTTVNTKTLQPGQGTPGCFLNAQGRIRAYFRLWRYGTSEYAFEFDAGSSNRWKLELLSVVEQFTFAEKLQISNVEGLECKWLFPEIGCPLLSEVTAHRTIANDDEIRICNQGTSDFGRPWLTVWGRTHKLDPWLDRSFPEVKTIDTQLLTQWRILATRPWIDAEILPDSNPLEVGLLDAIAQGKGCYPGQEVIEKIISLGSPAKRLVRLEGLGNLPTLGSKVLTLADPPQEIGIVTSSTAIGTTSDNKETYGCLATLRKTHGKEGLEVSTESSIARVVQVAKYAT